MQSRKLRAWCSYWSALLPLRSATAAIRGTRGRSTGTARGPLAHRERGRPAVAGIEHVLRVRGLAVVGQGEPAADARDRLERIEPEHPVDDVEVVRAEVGHLPAGVVPEPAEVVQAPVRVVP